MSKPIKIGLIAVGALVAAYVVLIVFAVAPWVHTDEGPLAVPASFGKSAVGLPAPVGQPVELLVPFGKPGTVVTVKDAALVTPSPGLKVVGVGLPPVGADIQYGAQYKGRPLLALMPVTYDGPRMLVMLVRADKPGTYDGLGVAVTYTVDGRTWSTTIPQGVRLCAGAATCDAGNLTDKMEGA